MFDAAGWVVRIVKDARAVVLRRPQCVNDESDCRNVVRRDFLDASGVSAEFLSLRCRQKSLSGYPQYPVEEG